MSESTARVLLYSDDRTVRQQLRLALGRRVAADLPVLETVECATYQAVLKTLDAGDPRLSGKVWKITASLKKGITQDDAKKISKLVRDEGPKGVRTQIQGDELRVSSKSRNDLQAVQALIKEQDYDFAIQFTNYR